MRSRMVTFQNDKLLGRTRFSMSKARRVLKSRTSKSSQSENRLNMAGTYNRVPRECLSYVADSSDCKHFGEGQGDRKHRCTRDGVANHVFQHTAAQHGMRSRQRNFDESD